MITYIRQDKNFCLLAALCQLDPVRWDYKKLRNTYDYNAPKSAEFISKLGLKPLAVRLFSENRYTLPIKTGTEKKHIPTIGKGLVIVSLGGITERHALSYENGRILDSQRSAPGRLETWAQYKDRTGHIIETIVPIEEF